MTWAVTVPGSYLSVLSAADRRGELLDGVGEVEDRDSQFPGGLRIVLDLGDVRDRARGSDHGRSCSVSVRDGRLNVTIHEEPSLGVAGPEVETPDVPATIIARGTDIHPFSDAGETAGDGRPQASPAVEDDADVVALTEADVRRIARAEATQAILESLGVDGRSEDVDRLPDGRELIADEVRRVRGAFLDPEAMLRERGSRSIVDPIHIVDNSHRGTPSVAGPVLDTPDDPATTVGDTTDIRPVGSGDVGQSAGASASAPALTPNSGASLRDSIDAISGKQQSLAAAIREIRRDLGRIADALIESSPLRSGSEAATSEVPAATVAETTDTDLRGAGESAGPGSPTARPALAGDGRHTVPGARWGRS